MKTFIATLKSVSPYSQSRHYLSDRTDGESHDDHYRRTWREHIHVDDRGFAFIPPMAFKNCVSEAAKFLQVPIPGRGKSQYTKHFEAGVLVVKPLPLGIHKDKVDHECLFLPSDGRRGSGKRIDKYYPIFHSWEGDVEFLILDETVLQTHVQHKDMTVFEFVLRGAGNFIGIGRFRPKNNGFYGRFSVEAVAVG